ncbi:MAG: glycosyltransferase family 4 protein [Dongiaceae bacterium]
MRVLALLPEAYGAGGGIAQFDRDLLAAAARAPAVSEIVTLLRRLPGAAGPVPERVRLVPSAARGKLAFAGAALHQALLGGRFQLVLCGHLRLLPLAHRAARLAGARQLLVVYGIDAWQPSGGAADRLVPRVDRVLSISELTRQRLIAWSGLAPERAVVLPPTVDLRPFGPGPRSPALAARYGLQGKAVLLTLGRLAAAERYKGIDEVLECLPALLAARPDLAYLVAGDGDDRPRLEAKAAALGLGGRVVFCGRVPEAEKAEHYRLADAFVMPGRGEGFGIVYLEAMACGIPVLGSRLDASREALRQGELGILVDPDDAAALQAGILAALARPKAVPAGLAHFHADRFAERVAALLASLAPGGGAMIPGAAAAREV